MGRPPPRRRRRRTHRRSNNRLSALPDGVLHQILSLLPIDAAVRTSVLSSRWHHLWSTNPSLHFPTFTGLDAEIDDDDYVDGIDSCLDLCDSTEHFTSLSFTASSFYTIDQRQVMANRYAKFASTSLVDSLSLTYDYPMYDIDYNRDEAAWFLPFPETLFCCWSITTLKLDHCALYEIPAEVGLLVFPFLETVFLRSVAFVAEYLSGLISASPKLKTLNIAGSRFTDRIVISSQTLETLDVYRNVFHIRCAVEIRSAPRLRFIGLCCDLTLSKTVPLVNIEEITLLNDPRKKFHDRTQWRCLLSAVKNARVLGVDDWFTQFELNGDCDINSQMPVFGNLKRLEFCGRPAGFTWVIRLLYNMSEFPVLEELYLKLNCIWSRERTAAANDDANSDGSDVVSAGILRKLKKDVLVVPPLKSVMIDDFTGEAAITTLVQFLLYKASLLESVVLYHHKRFVNVKKSVAKAHRKMLSAPKASPSVKITTIDSSNFSYDSVLEKKLRQIVHWNPFFCD